VTQDAHSPQGSPRQTDRFWIYDERAMQDTESASVLCCEDTAEDARDAVEELGHPAVIEDTQSGELEYYVPLIMRSGARESGGGK
jgi:hypothetical protein